MRVITGTARGRKLTAPDGIEIRPTTDMVKESIFSIIQFDIPGAAVLDLFAGTGQMGIEALSRGAASVSFVDSSKQAIAAIKQNLEATELLENAKIYPMDAKAYLMSAGEHYDIALLDPPYNKGVLVEVLPSVARHMAKNSVILCETQLQELLPETAGDFVLRRTYRYGKVKVWMYKNDGGED
ncbi:MAG: 16S rRNA (guanine(966)-N(2))-methyltransferase RsmD [Hydrogenoanaerobacterium sp.]